MNSRCSICLETLVDESSPMTTLCGHLYCLDCATYNFADPGATCAICRRPHDLDALIRLYADYEPAPQHASTSARQVDVADLGRDVLNACHDALETDDGPNEVKIGLVLGKADDLVGVLSSQEDGAPHIQNLLRNIIEVLGDIRSKVDKSSQIATMEKEREFLYNIASVMKNRLIVAKRTQEAERASRAAELVEQRTDWAQKASELEERLQETSSLLAAERAKLAATNTVAMDLDVQMRQWRSQTARYKKKYHALKKDHNAMKNGIEDAFFADESLEVI